MAIDVTLILAAISEQAVPIGAVGSAVLLVAVGVRAIRWVLAALDAGYDPRHEFSTEGHSRYE